MWPHSMKNKVAEIYLNFSVMSFIAKKYDFQSTVAA